MQRSSQLMMCMAHGCQGMRQLTVFIQARCLCASKSLRRLDVNRFDDLQAVCSCQSAIRPSRGVRSA